jgi:hypothetical protein
VPAWHRLFSRTNARDSPIGVAPVASATPVPALSCPACRARVPFLPPLEARAGACLGRKDGRREGLTGGRELSEAPLSTPVKDVLRGGDGRVGGLAGHRPEALRNPQETGQGGENGQKSGRLARRLRIGPTKFHRALAMVAKEPRETLSSDRGVPHETVPDRAVGRADRPVEVRLLLRQQPGQPPRQPVRLAPRLPQGLPLRQPPRQPVRLAPWLSLRQPLRLMAARPERVGLSSRSARASKDLDWRRPIVSFSPIPHPPARGDLAPLRARKPLRRVAGVAHHQQVLAGGACEA